MSSYGTAVIAKLRREEDGSLSNKLIELYVLLRAEEVVSTNAAWIIVTTSGGRTRRSGSYQANIHKSPVFKERLAELIQERKDLEELGMAGDLLWMIKQNYRRAVAHDDVREMNRATEQLLKIVLPSQRAAAAKESSEEEAEETETKKGPGAPVAPTPQPEDAQADYFERQLLGR